MTPSDRRRLILLLLGAVLTVVGIVVVVLALRRTDTVSTDVAADALTRTLIVMFAGGIMFAFGSMMLLVGLVRPLFEKRRVDDAAERLR